jgi:predicted RNA binding protein YcfA (HicA-like mRNA interferase family)
LPKLPAYTAKEAELLLLKFGFELLRVKGSHFIYRKGEKRIVLPFHTGKTLHPKIVRQVMDAIRE